MKFGSHSRKAKANHSVVAALTLLMAVASAGQTAGAQEAMSAEQDSLLPPEVVPLDPSAANSISAAQAAKRQVQAAGDAAQVPGLVDTSAPTNPTGYMSAQDARKAAFESLYGQGQLPTQPMNQWRAGQVSMTSSQPNSMTNQGPYSTPPQTLANSLPAQQQTLTGGSKHQPKVHDIRRAGFSNGLSALAGFGAGAVTAGYMMHGIYSPMSLGMFGLTMTGFGVRNAFRF